MKIFAVLTIIALVGSSHAFIGEIADMFKNLGHELGAVGKDLLHVAEPVAVSLLQTLEKAGTQLLTTAASDLITHIGTGKRNIGDLIDKVSAFVANGKEYLKETATLLEGAFKGTIAKVHDEITSVLADAKPIQHLVQEVKDAVEGHNNFVNNLINKAEEEGQKLLSEFMHLVPHKRDLSATLHSFGASLKALLQEAASPLKSVLSSAISTLESQVLHLLG